MAAPSLSKAVVSMTEGGWTEADPGPGGHILAILQWTLWLDSGGRPALVAKDGRV